MGFIKGIGHFGLSVADLDESIRFYRDILGLEPGERRAQDAFFPLGEGDVLALIQYPGGAERFEAEMRPKNRGKSFTHFGFKADSAQAVFDFQKHLEAHGVRIVKAAYERRDGVGLYFLDPNGYTLEFIYYVPENQREGAGQ